MNIILYQWYDYSYQGPHLYKSCDLQLSLRSCSQGLDIILDLFKMVTKTILNRVTVVHKHSHYFKMRKPSLSQAAFPNSNNRTAKTLIQVSAFSFNHFSPKCRATLVHFHLKYYAPWPCGLPLFFPYIVISTLSGTILYHFPYLSPPNKCVYSWGFWMVGFSSDGIYFLGIIFSHHIYDSYPHRLCNKTSWIQILSLLILIVI